MTGNYLFIYQKMTDIRRDFLARLIPGMARYAVFAIRDF